MWVIRRNVSVWRRGLTVTFLAQEYDDDETGNYEFSEAMVPREKTPNLLGYASPSVQELKLSALQALPSRQKALQLIEIYFESYVSSTLHLFPLIRSNPLHRVDGVYCSNQPYRLLILFKGQQLSIDRQSSIPCFPLHTMETQCHYPLTIFPLSSVS